jgi:hypothetical protein
MRQIISRTQDRDAPPRMQAKQILIAGHNHIRASIQSERKQFVVFLIPAIAYFTRDGNQLCQLNQPPQIPQSSVQIRIPVEFRPAKHRFQLDNHGSGYKKFTLEHYVVDSASELRIRQDHP